MNTTNTNTDSILTHNQKTGLAITGFSLLIGAMVFLVGTGVLILSMFLFGLGVYMFFKKDEEIGKEPLIQTKENYFYQKPLFERDCDEEENDFNFGDSSATDLNLQPMYSHWPAPIEHDIQHDDTYDD